MEIHQLRYFVAVAEHGGMREAARASHVAQPSLSTQIQKLERELGQRLFDRSRTGVTLTEAGRALLPRARGVLNEVASIGEDAEAADAARAQRARLGAIPTMAPYVLPPMVRRATRLGVRLHLTENLTDALAAEVAAGGLDAAVLSTPVRHAGVEVEVVGREPLLVALPASHPLARADRPLTLARLRDEPAVVLDSLHCLGQQAAEFCDRQRLASMGTVTCRGTQLQTLLALVRDGMGFSLIPDMARRDLERRGETGALAFRRLAGRGGVPHRNIAIAWPRSRPRHPAADRVLTGLRDADPGGDDA